MAAIIRYNKIVVATETSATSATLAEVSNYTISWSDLTTAGFGNGDDVIILCRQSVGGTNGNGKAGRGEWRIGSTFAGASKVLGSDWLTEPQAAGAEFSHHHSWFDRVTLATNDNIYCGHGGDGATYSGLSSDLSVLILRLDDLAAGDWRYDENATLYTTAPTTYDTNGASVTVPGNASGNDWLLISSVHFLCDVSTKDLYAAMSYAGTDYGEVRWETEDPDEARTYAVYRYVTGVTANQTLQARYKAEAAGDADIDCSRVFALRLSAFREHDGVQDTTTITHTVVDTNFNNAQEYAGLPTYAHGGSGANDLILLGATRQGVTGDATKVPHQRIQIGGADALSSLGAIAGASNHSADDYLPHVVFGIESQSNGSLDIDADVAEDRDVNPNPTHNYHTLVAFSAELASAAVSGLLMQMMMDN